MLIEFSVSNFRSIKEEQTLTMVADSGKLKLENTFVPESKNKLCLLKSAVIYGANASGKTNIIKAFFALTSFILDSSKLYIGDDIFYYEPFEFDESYRTSPSHFKIVFLGIDNIKYNYSISFDKKKIFSEILDFYPKGQKANLFIRTNNDEVKLGGYFTDKRQVPKKILENHLYLSETGNSPHKQMNGIYNYFKNRIKTGDLIRKLGYTKQMLEILVKEDNAKLKRRLDKFIRIADTQINSISISEKKEHEFILPENFPNELKQEIFRQNKYKIESVHNVYDNGEILKATPFNFDEESNGTKVLYALGGLILEKFETGGVIFFDELESSLHPKLCKFIVKLFHHPKVNPRNVQLIFSTHETTLLDKELFRKDQIWITEKNKYGETDLFSVTDFEGVPDDIPFEQWYMKGKFGGLPNIKEIQFIFGDE
ncbi:AAA family ATPase [Desulfonema magnum]|uniref:AAA ATPase domain-containing protein n=1 Tax=Desulfonema magnum TaxID=45655 RepID=A0A975BLC2_9BACT|nr:ATP-binding protein [Desulfonema magnum]QTA87533.1 AAA ATPase domain-containing protein [Desulfonema magnum]